jgi:membrane protease YdiL (CAAX protease family)
LLGPINRDFFELSVGFGLIMVAVWSPLPVQRLLFWVTFSWILATTLLSRQDRETLGLGVQGIRRSLWIVGIAVLLAATQIVIAMQFSALHPMYGPVPVGRHMWGYVIWAFLQQFILQDFFLLRLLRLMPSPKSAVIVAASLFAIVHLPNPLLTVATLVWGLVACTIFLRYRSLYSLGLIHGILGLCIAVSVPNAIHHHMRVGLGYLLYNAEQSNRADASKPQSNDLPDGTNSPATLRQQ